MSAAASSSCTSARPGTHVSIVSGPFIWARRLWLRANRLLTDHCEATISRANDSWRKPPASDGRVVAYAFLTHRSQRGYTLCGPARPQTPWKSSLPIHSYVYDFFPLFFDPPSHAAATQKTL
eukprot:1193073-Prorocentrum_minimum.AAC.1